MADIMNTLSDVKLRTVATPGRYFDGGGLYLDIKAGGGRYWRLKYRFAGKEKLLACGVYPAVSLKQARARRDDARKLLAAGTDPSEQRKADKAQGAHEAETTFKAVAREWLAHQSSRWTEGTLAAITTSIEQAVFPSIGSKPMAQIRPGDVKAIVTAIDEAGKGETAGRVLQRVKAVFRYAVVHERIESNPMLDLKPDELLKPRQVKHRAALDEKGVPGFLAALEAYDGEPTTKAGLRLLMLTAVRPGELRGARWAEIDVEAAEWRIPAERMKMKAPHVVPLSRQALQVVEGMRQFSGDDELVFPSPFYPGKVMSENTLNSALARMGYKGEHSAHGFRALFGVAPFPRTVTG